MSVLLDILLFATIIFFAFAVKKDNNITDELTSLASMLFSSFASVKFSNFVAVSTYTLFFRGDIISKLLPLTTKIYRMEGVSTNYERVLRYLPDFISNAVQSTAFADETTPVLIDRYACHPAEQAAGEIADLVAAPVIEAVFYSVYLLLSFFIFNYIFKIIFSVLKADLKGIIEYNDAVLTRCVGAVRGFIFVLLVMAVIRLTLPCFGLYNSFFDCVEQTIFFRIMFNDNILILL